MYNYNKNRDGNTLVTQAKFQRRPNCTELRSIDSYNRIFSRFQKYKRKVPPTSPLFGQKKNVVKKYMFMEVIFFSRNNFFPSSKQKLFSFLHIGTKFFFSERSKKNPICKKLNNSCLDDRKNLFLEKKIYFHKHVLLDDVFFSDQRGRTDEELFHYIFGIY